MFELLRGDCRVMLAALDNNSIDSVVTDPPYGLSKQPDVAEVMHHWLAGDDYEATGGGFMGKTWDSFVPGPATWREVFRVLKPGGYALVFAGSRTQDLMSMSLRLAGFEIRDTVMWLYGSGFPASLATRFCTLDRYDWSTHSTALKPAYEPVIIIRKPLDGTVADNVLTYGTGTINIDGCRVGDEVVKTYGRGAQNGTIPIVPQSADYEGSSHSGRWPANIMHDGCLDDEPFGRYFYSPKASKADRNAGLEHLRTATAGEVTGGRAEGSAALNCPRTGAGRTSGAKNTHPTVKPTELMQYLCRMVTPPGGRVLDPFAGSGSTGKAAILEGFYPIMIEMTPEYWPIIDARCSWACVQRFDEE